MSVLVRLLTFPLAAIAAAALTACGEVEDVARNDRGERRGPTEGGVSHVVRVEASILLLPLAKKASDVVDRPAGVEVELKATTSGKALARLCAGKADGGLSDRRMTEAERGVCEANGISPVRSLVAHQVVALYRHERLAIGCLTVEQLRRLWRPGSQVERYSELGRALPERRVKLIAYPTQSAAYEFFARQITGAERPLREDARAVDRLDFEREVSSTAGSLAFGPYAHPPAGARPRLVAVNAGRGCVRPSAETVQSGAYRPLSAPLFMYSTRAELARAPVKAFVDYILDNPREVASYPGVVPPERAEYPEAEPRS